MTNGPPSRDLEDRMRRVAKLVDRLDVLQHWAARWRRDQKAAVQALREALAAERMMDAARHCGQLEALDDSHFTILFAALDRLATEAGSALGTGRSDEMRSTPPGKQAAA
jgi:hypothetical protein